MRSDWTAAGESLRQLFDSFEDKYVISLASRPDRRKRVKDSLKLLGIDFEAAGIRWFDGLVFSEAAGFPGIGVRGCFNSHFALMRQCAANGRPMLVMEDDIDFDASTLADFRHAGTLTGRDDWDLVYLGYLDPVSPPSGNGLARYDGRTIGGHFYAVQPGFAAAMAEFMASCLTRPPGHPDGGPMYRDAAFNFYRQHNPDSDMWLATPSLAGQFSSRSDLSSKPAFYDRLPGLRRVAELGRQLFGGRPGKLRSSSR